MKGLKRPSILWLLALVSLALLPLLAFWQYRWLGEISVAERERMLRNLQESAAQFSAELDRELTETYLFFQPEPLATTATELAPRYREWQAKAKRSQLVKGIYEARRNSQGQFELTRFEPATERFEPSALTNEFAQVLARLNAPPQEGMITPQLIQRVIRKQVGEVGQKFSPTLRKTITLSPARALDAQLPGLLIPLASTEPAAIVMPAAYRIVWLDLSYLRQQLLPALAQRFLIKNGLNDFTCAVLPANDSEPALYRSAENLSAKALTQGDVSVPLFGLRLEEFNEMPNHGHWRLVVQHRAGSLEAAVNQVRRRNLAISFGVLLLLGLSVGLMWLASRRAQALADRQLEFVAGVSHELRTPLTVICTAAENLADGVVAQPEQVKQYGSLIRDEGRRLGGMVEQVLEFAGAQSGKRTYDLRVVSAQAVIDDALAALQMPLAEQGFTVEAHWPVRSPQIQADQAALSRALQNLLLNAMKYSGENRWIGLRVETVVEELRIIVQDRGLGIPADELPHLGEPFFRGKAAVAAQIHGNGLGLSLIKHITQAHGGRLSVNSIEGKGSVFTLHLPLAVDASEPSLLWSESEVR